MIRETGGGETTNLRYIKDNYMENSIFIWLSIAFLLWFCPPQSWIEMFHQSHLHDWKIPVSLGSSNEGKQHFYPAACETFFILR